MQILEVDRILKVHTILEVHTTLEVLTILAHKHWKFTQRYTLEVQSSHTKSKSQQSGITNTMHYTNARVHYSSLGPLRSNTGP